MTMKLHCKLPICIGQWSFNCGNSEIQYVFYKVKIMRYLKNCAECTGLTLLHGSNSNSENFHFLIKICISNVIFCIANSLLTFFTFKTCEETCLSIGYLLASSSFSVGSRFVSVQHIQYNRISKLNFDLMQELCLGLTMPVPSASEWFKTSRRVCKGHHQSCQYLC